MFRVVVRSLPVLETQSTVNIGECIPTAFTGHGELLSLEFAQPRVSPQQALQIAARELQLPPDDLAAYAEDTHYTVCPRLPEDTLGGGESIDIDINSGSIIRRYFSE